MQHLDIAHVLLQTFIVTLKLSAPALGAALVVGLIISLIQAVTQINEATLAFVPKLIAIGLALLFTGSFMGRTLMIFARGLFDQVILIGGT
ncbi:flagellar biosynthetic protein FliQ [Brytella acorum]|uniref:Flagellar biosynthetic protein FliQ n=1 Tax=Brytella acorum TaxID=2959299 RepID=A0AA35V9I1_9PROT|nr:flagellar biosynthetic protein FliQ [Brytella acorum]MDF3624922.1 flagellar biosynthetic protein FliQ [Brytella acorum]CAI9120228.1 flagellar biosynthetic protein FliQ [Brytella acorum]